VASWKGSGRCATGSEGGSLTLRAEADAGSVRLTVQDSGPGIPPEHLPHIFERFYKVDTARAATPVPSGSGLGLSIVKAIVARHGGEVRAAGVEASTGGLLAQPEQVITDLSSIRAQAEQLEFEHPSARGSARKVEAEVSRMAASYLRGVETLSGEAIAELARAYEETRASMEPGDARTERMTRIVNEARVRADGDPGAAGVTGLDLLRAPGEGDRIVGLALLQVAPDRAALDLILTRVTSSASAFEAYHALLALEALAPLLAASERARAIEALARERSDPRGVGVMRDRYLPQLIERVAGRLEEA
jgi:hypothetical protein